MAELLFISAGSGAVGSPDRFAPKYLVGNVPRGDSPVPYSAGGFVYFPDTGNGAGIAVALAAADPLMGGVQGDVWIRPGIYDTNLPGAPVGPFSVPDSCRVTGTGPDLTGGGPPVGQILGRTTGDQGVFVLGSGTGLRDLAIVTGATGGPYAGSVDLIRCNGAAQINNVLPINPFGGDPAQVLRNYIGIYGDAPVEIDGMFAVGSGFNDPLDANWQNLVRVFNPDALVSLRNIAAQNFDAVLWQDGGNLVASMQNVQMIGITRRGVYQAGGLPAFVSMDASCLLLASGVDCIGAELWPLGLLAVSQITKARFYGGGPGMVGPAILVHGDVAPSSGGRVRIEGNFALWERPGGAVIELGAAGSLEQCDRCSVEGNILMNLDVLGEGVRVSNVNCNKNIIGGGSIEVAVPANALVDFGTLTTSYPISV